MAGGDPSIMTTALGLIQEEEEEEEERQTIRNTID